MSIPIIETKLVPPAPSHGHVARERLEGMLSGSEGLRLLTLTAGAGWGKTSLLAAAVAREERRVLWYSLDGEDRHPEVFMAHLGHAQGGGLDTDQEGPFLGGLVAAWRSHRRGTVLVLDDLQRLGTEGPVLDLIAQLVRHLPERCTLVLASREPVGLATARYEGLGKARRLLSRDLAFHPEEILAWWRRLQPDCAPTEAQMERLARRTEGWAAGLQLFFQLAVREQETGVEAALRRLDCAGTGWFDFFAEEVLGGLDEPTREFLLGTSVLPRLDPDLCDALLERRDSRRVLADLADRNLFTFPVGDGRREWRYHHLFREFLQTTLGERRTADRRDQLYRRAGSVLSAAGHWVDALTVLSLGRNPGPAMALLERKSRQLLQSGRYTELGRALERLGEEAVAASGDALFLQGHVFSLHGRWDRAEDCWRRALRRRPGPARRVELQSQLAQLQMRGGRFRRCLQTCRRALGSDEGLTRRSRARLLGWQGVSHCALGHLRKGEADLLEAVRLSRRIRDREGEGRHLFLLAANVHYIQGRFPEAEETARRALVLFRDLGDRHMVCHSLGVLGFVLIGAGSFPEGEKCSREALREAESLGYRNIEGYCHLNLGHCALRATDPAAALDHFTRAQTIGRQLGEASLQTLALTGRAWAEGYDGGRAAACRHAAGALERARGGDDLWPASQAALALGYFQVEDSRRRQDAWAEAEEILRRLGAQLDLARLELWRLVGDQVPDPEWSPRLNAFLEGLIEHGHEFLLERLEPSQAARLRQEAERRPGGPDLQQPRWQGLLPLPEVAAEGAGTAGPTGTPEVRIEGREAKGSLRLRIEVLGPLQVHAPQGLLLRRHWRSARALRLLALVLVGRLRFVHRDKIMEALWPEADPRKSANSLRQSLHILRRSLFPAGESPFLVRRDELFGPDPDLEIACDLLEFEQARSEAAARQRQGETEAAAAARQRALDLYRGPFFSDGPTLDFVDEERDRLHMAHRRTAENQLRHLERQGCWEQGVVLCRRVIPLHPGEDNLHEWLVRGYLELGQRGEALAAYRVYEKQLAREWDLLPTETMRRLAEKAAQLG